MTRWRIEETLKLQRSYFRSVYKDLEDEEHNNKIWNTQVYKKLL